MDLDLNKIVLKEWDKIDFFDLEEIGEIKIIQKYLKFIKEKREIFET